MTKVSNSDAWTFLVEQCTQGIDRCTKEIEELTIVGKISYELEMELQSWKSAKNLLEREQQFHMNLFGSNYG